MKKITTTLAACALAIGLAGCAPNGSVTKQQVGTVAGGLAGGILGASVFHGSGKAFGAVGGAVLGGLLGSAIGQSMDQQDQINAKQAMATVPVGQEASWTNRRTHTQYTVRPVRNYYSHGRRCRVVKVTTVRYSTGKRKVITTKVCPSHA